MLRLFNNRNCQFRTVESTYTYMYILVYGQRNKIILKIRQIIFYRLGFHFEKPNKMSNRNVNAIGRPPPKRIYYFQVNYNNNKKKKLIKTYYVFYKVSI